MDVDFAPKLRLFAVLREVLASHGYIRSGLSMRLFVAQNLEKGVSRCVLGKMEVLVAFGQERYWLDLANLELKRKKQKIAAQFSKRPKTRTFSPAIAYSCANNTEAHTYHYIRPRRYDSWK